MFRFTRVLVLSASLAAVAIPGIAHASTQYPYTLVDPGTFGGPQSFLNLPAVPLTDHGGLLGTADTSIPDTDATNPFIVGFPDPTVAHAFEFQNGQLRDLGALAGENSSSVFEVNSSGVGVGASETTTYDPNTGWPADHAVMYVNGQVKDLGTLPGGFESQANDINDGGVVSGFSSNGVPDPYSYAAFAFPNAFANWGTQARSFVWQNGVMKDIGTLGGPDAVSQTLNERGQITGMSYTNSTPTAAYGVPTVDPFLWQNGRMRDLGTLGGAFGFANWLNNSGEVVGQSALAGDQTAHPFLWNGTRMIDLGTVGGTFGVANWISDSGDAVGGSTTVGDTNFHATLWKNGTITDLTGADSPQCTDAHAVNDGGEVVGDTCDGTEALLWAHGRQYDLSTLVAPSTIRLVETFYINDEGDIVALGVLPDGSTHTVLLTRNRGVSLPSATATTAGALREHHLRAVPGHGLSILSLLGRKQCRSLGCRVLLAIAARR